MRPRLRLYAACVLVGVAAAAAALVLRFSVHSLERALRAAMAARSLPKLALALLPTAGIALTVLFARKVARADLSHGVSKVLASIARDGGDIPSRMIWAPLAGCTITVGSGGSMGMEAPIMHAGSAIGSALSRAFGFDNKKRVLLVGCGAAAAVAGIFKAPIAGTLFAIEILMIDFSAQAAVPILVSSVTAALVAMVAQGPEPSFRFAADGAFDFRDAPAYLLLGALGGLIAAYLRSAQRGAGKAASRLRPPAARALAGGLALAPLVLLFPPLFGEGFSGMGAMLSGDARWLAEGSPLSAFSGGGDWGFVAYLALLVVAKGLATSVTGSAGGVGGVFAPSLFMGGAAGLCLARSLALLGLGPMPERSFALVGMAAVLSGLLKAPLTSIFLIAEISGGYALLLPLILGSGAGYLAARAFSPYSIYAEELALKRELVTHDKDASALDAIDPYGLVDPDYPRLAPEATIADLARAALESRKAIVAVVDSAGLLLGIIRFDEARKLLLSRADAAGVCVCDAARPPRALLGPGMGMEDVMARFDETGAEELPYVSADGTLCGFVSRSEALGAYRAKMLDLFVDE
jgi:CIC family chloride channel protein